MDYKIGQEVFFIDTSYMHQHWHSLCIKHGKIIMDTSMGIDTIEDDEGFEYYDVLNSNVFLDYESALAEFQKKYNEQKRICSMTDLEWSIYEIEKVLNRWKNNYDVPDSLYNEVKQWLLSDPHVEDIEVRLIFGAIQYRYDPCVYGESQDVHRFRPLKMKYWPRRHPINIDCLGWKNGWQTVPMLKEDIREEYFSPIKNSVHKWDEDQFKRYDKTRGSMRHIQGVEAYIYQMYGAYDIHRYYTPLGFTVYVSEDGKILCGNMDAKMSGKMYNISLINMYGRTALNVIRISSNYVYGWTNKDGGNGYVISTRCKNLDTDTITKIFDNPEFRFDDLSTKFMNFCKSVFESDKTNYFCVL